MTSPARIISGCICGNHSCIVPYGICHCGCEKKVSIASRNDNRCHSVKGYPRKFIAGHVPRIIPEIEDAAPFKIDGVYCRLIPLSQGLYAIVWESDYEWLMQWKWCAAWMPSTEMFYAVRSTSRAKGKHRQTIFMHRLILGLGQSEEDSKQGDHVRSTDTLDNRRSNLRIATHAQQQQNKGLTIRNKTGYKGVRFHKGRGMYRADIWANGKQKTLGYRETAEAAWRELYVPAALKYHGEFACLK